MTVMFGKDPRTAARRSRPWRRHRGPTVAGFNSQLATTKMFNVPADAVAFTSSPNLLKTMDLVRTFSFNHGLLGQGARSAGRGRDGVSRRQNAGQSRRISSCTSIRPTCSSPRTANFRQCDIRCNAGPAEETYAELVNRHPGRGAGWLLGVVPFIALLCIYLVGSHIRTAENPDDKLLPTPATIASTMHSYAVEEDVRSGEVLFWVDTVASLKRILIALGAVCGDRPHHGSRDRRRTGREGGAGAVRWSGGDDSAPGGAAHPVHPVGTG